MSMTSAAQLVEADLRDRGYAFADEREALIAIIDQLLMAPLGPVTVTVRERLRSMNEAEAIRFYSQFSKLKEL
jgi:hypothetical protein